MIFAIDKNGQQVSVVLSPNAIARGGEAELFEVAEQPEQVAKVFLPKHRTEAKRDKINYLIQHNPNQIGDNDVIWPTHTLWENGQFIGFLMPKAIGEKLELLCSPAPKGKNLAKFLQKYPEWQRFLLSEPQGLTLRLKLAYNLLVAVEKLHKMGLYVLVDLKPENIIIQPDCSVVIVDTDSLQIVDNQLFFAANVCTPEYCPAEYYQGQDFTKSPISPTWDYFSLAVVIYRLLLGIHPFSASCKGQYQDCTSIDQLIKNGLLPVMLSLSQHFHTVPPPHNEFFKLPVLVRNYLLNSLQTATNRPNPAEIIPEWCALIQDEIENLNKLGDGWSKIFKKYAATYFNFSDFFSKAEQLTKIDCSNTSITSLEPLQGLKNLIELNCANTRIDSLEPLRDLKNLIKLNCADTKIDSLEPLRDLKNLIELDFSGTKINNLEPLRNLSNLKDLNCSKTSINNLESLDTLQNLTKLNVNSTKIKTLSELQSLKNLSELCFSKTQVISLGALQSLGNLTKIDCSYTPINNLEALWGLQKLTTIICSHTPIKNIEPLENLQNLIECNCSFTQINNLEPLRNLLNLMELDFSHTNVGVPSFWQKLMTLFSSPEDEYSSAYFYLEPLKGLKKMTKLKFSHTPIKNLTALQELKKIIYLDCNHTQVKTLSPLGGIYNLVVVYCKNTPMTDEEIKNFTLSNPNFKINP